MRQHPKLTKCYICSDILLQANHSLSCAALYELQMPWHLTSFQEIEDEMSDGGKLLPLSSRYRNKSINVQKRVLRRIIEKKQSQMAHRFFGHTDNLLSKRIANVFSKRCMKEVSRHQSYDVTPIAHTIQGMATELPKPK